jgi:hypothetical protein
MTLLTHPTDATVFAPDLPRTFEPTRPQWQTDKKLTVSVLLHAPYYQDTVAPGQYKPLTMQGGVGRETSEPRHGQVARLSQWDFGLTTGIFRLLTTARRLGVPVGVALDEYGCTRMPGLAQTVARDAGEIVARGTAANIIISPEMTDDAERAYIAASKATVEAATGRGVAGWFSPERGSSPRTARLLAEAGFSWFGDWPLDEVPVRLDGSAKDLVSLPFGLETEDMFALFGRGIGFDTYERMLDETVEQLIGDADATGHRFLGLSWFGWVLGQACYADVAERVLARLAANPDVQILLPSEAAALAG